MRAKANSPEGQNTGTKENHITEQAFTVSFIIPAYNEALFIPKCISSINALRHPPEIKSFEIIVVDTGSTDSTCETSIHLGAMLVPVRMGTTIAAARNAGTQAASGEYLAFIDADCELDPSWLLFNLEHIRLHGAVAAGTAISQPESTASWVERIWYHLGYKIPDGEFSEVDWLPTLNLLIRRDIFNAVGGFNKSLVTCEDVDLGQRLQKQGRLILEMRGKVRHLRESRTLYEFFRREAWRARNSLSSFFEHGYPTREILSALGPVAFLVLVFGGGVSLIAGIFRPAFLIAATILAILTLSIPILMIFRARVRIRTLLELIQYYCLSFTYLLARGLAGLAFPMKRYISTRAISKGEAAD